MTEAIIKKEILENILSFRFMIITLLLAILISTSMYVMYHDYELRLENYEILRPNGKEPIAIIPPAPLSIFAKGLDESIGRSYIIRFGGQINVGSKQQSINRLFQLFTPPDLLYIIRVIMSLCAILFAFDSITREKEGNTLRLALSNNVERTSFIIGKWVGGYTGSVIPFLALLLPGIILIIVSPRVELRSDDWLRLGIFILISLFYTAAFFSLGMFVSTLSHRSASSLVLSLFAWTIIVFVIPNLGNILARQFVEIPSVQQLEMARQHIWIREIFDLIQKEKSGEKSKTLQDVNSIVNGDNDKLVADYRGRFNYLVRVSKSITRVSPAAAFDFIATDLAGTGINEMEKSKEAVLRYKDLVWEKPTDSDGNIMGEFPSFVYERTQLRDILNADGMANILIIILCHIIAFAAAYVLFLRYDVR